MNKIFRTNDSALRARNGQSITVIGPMEPSDFDLEETGPMYRVEFDDGIQASVFKDEICDE